MSWSPQSRIVAIATTNMWAGTLSWWNRTTFVGILGLFCFILSRKCSSRFALHCPSMILPFWRQATSNTFENHIKSQENHKRIQGECFPSLGGWEWVSAVHLCPPSSGGPWPCLWLQIVPKSCLDQLQKVPNYRRTWSTTALLFSAQKARDPLCWHHPQTELFGQNVPDSLLWDAQPGRYLTSWQSSILHHHFEDGVIVLGCGSSCRPPGPWFNFNAFFAPF